MQNLKFVFSKDAFLVLDYHSHLLYVKSSAPVLLQLLTQWVQNVPKKFRFCESVLTHNG